ncbi:MAG: DUF1566 domain-containing protein [Prevotellaceae bacterium]|jgi:hypothetical protein|nr:DUF1566 domain-containing protein [Prevotellaceae bacterium]
MKRVFLILVQVLFVVSLFFAVSCSKENGEEKPSPDLTLELLPSSLAFKAIGGAPQTVLITTNASSWTYSCEDSWITITITDNQLDITVEDNELGENTTRSAMVTVIAGDKNNLDKAKTESLIITQSGETEGPYSIGSIYYETGVAGIVYKVSANGLNGMIASLTETQTCWGPHENIVTGAIDLDDGMINMNAIKDIPDWESNYLAFKWCDDFNKADITGWYLPAKNELADIYAGFSGLSSFPGEEEDAPTKYAEARDQFNATLVQYGGMAMSTDSYWSSSQFNMFISHAWRLNFHNGYSSGYSNFAVTEGVRAVRAF